MTQKMCAQLYLASTSPRRSELLEQIGIKFLLTKVSVDETPGSDETPLQIVERLAREKAQAGWLATAGMERLPVLGADTAVVVDDCILGKPQDRQQAMNMLGQLSNREHDVLTGVAITDGTMHSCVSQTRVRFREIGEHERAAYWNTGEAADKAGAYGIQGRAAIFVESISGSYTGVVGLPLFETARLLDRVGINPLENFG